MVTHVEGGQAGRSFSVPDLMIAQAWASYHGLDFIVDLDRKLAGALCEEVLRFSIPRYREWMIWRWGRQVLAQAHNGPIERFPTLAEALEGLHLNEFILSA